MQREREAGDEAKHPLLARICSLYSAPAKAKPQAPPQTPPQATPQTPPQAPPQAKTQKDKTLGPDDALKVLEEILEAQNASRFLGLKWNIPEYIISGIHSTYTEPKDRLYYVIVEFLKQLDPTPTWRVIADALKSPAVNLPRLAQKIERDHNLVVTSSPSRPAPAPSNPSGAHNPGALSDKPTLPKLLSFKTSSGQSIRIADQIGANFLTFGTLLLEDDTGAITNAIATRHQNNANAINQDILTRWLQGQGKKPVNWASLLEILEDVGLPELAQTVKDNL